jgi:hypothetical protein
MRQCYIKASMARRMALSENRSVWIFHCIVDLTPPQLNSIGKGDTVNLSPASRIVFTPTDNSGIKSFHAELDGKWLMFTNDKGRSWIYKFDEQCPFGVHELKVRVEDIVECNGENMVV